MKLNYNSRTRLVWKIRSLYLGPLDVKIQQEHKEQNIKVK